MSSGALVGDREKGRAEHRDKPGRFAAIAEQLDPADAQALRTLMQRQSEATEPRVRAIRAAREQVQAAMSRPDYDPATVRAAVASVRTEEAALRQELDGALIEFAVGLEPAERAAIAPLLRKGARGWRGDQRGHDGKRREGGDRADGRGRGDRP
jgi:uncharacterized membrane protein